MKEEVKNKERQSNYELMKIISMIFIVFFHILIHGKIIEHSNGAIELFLIFLESIIIVHVNSYILTTGFFQSNSRVKVSKIISINNMTWFYNVCIMLLLVYLKIIVKPDAIVRVWTYLPLDYGVYWFIGNYLILYLISPILNKVIMNSKKNDLRKIIIVLFIIISLLSTISLDVYFDTKTGRSLSTFILLYFIGAYLRKYPIEESYFFKPFSKEARQLIFLVLFFAFTILSTMCWITHTKVATIDNVVKYTSPIFCNLHSSLSSPIVIIQSILYFLYFGTISIKSKIINKINTCTLAVYLISENIHVRTTIYDLLGITKVNTIGIKFILLMMILAVVIFIVCILIELIRRKIFKFIYNLKISCKFRNAYRTYFKKLGLNINW